MEGWSIENHFKKFADYFNCFAYSLLDQCEFPFRNLCSDKCQSDKCEELQVPYYFIFYSKVISSWIIFGKHHGFDTELDQLTVLPGSKRIVRAVKQENLFCWSAFDFLHKR